MSLFEPYQLSAFPSCDSDDERYARLRLSRTPRIGPVNFYQLILRYHSAQSALDALPHIAKRAGGVSITPAAKRDIDAEIEAGEKSGARLLVLGDTGYPRALSQCDSAPPILWCLGGMWTLGDLTKLNRRSVAIVGARNASAAGQKMAKILATELGQAGYSIVSGMARGIDTNAHEGSLNTGTIAVLGGGINDIYPPQNEDLYHHIVAHGVILSESPPNHRAQAKDFPRRNRIISGLSLATIVVEAEMRSGSLITARLALEQNREVFAVPGSPLDPRCRGTNDLLRQGANMCETAQDIIAVLDRQLETFGDDDPIGLSEPSDSSPYSTPSYAAQTKPVGSSPLNLDQLDDLRSRLLSLLSQTPMSRDELLRYVNAPVHLGFAALSELEITGQIMAIENGAYIKA